MPQIIQEISSDIGLMLEQKATLLAAFFPIYICLMIPGGWIMETWGPKLCVTVDCALQAIALVLFPVAVSARTRTRAEPAAWAVTG